MAGYLIGVLGGEARAPNVRRNCTSVAYLFHGHYRVPLRAVSTTPSFPTLAKTEDNCRASFLD